MYPQLSAVIQRAHELLEKANPRAQYAHDVLDGRQRWSGADLKGKARRYSASYDNARRQARDALVAAGGTVASVERGLLVTAVELPDGKYLTECGVYHRVEGRTHLVRTEDDR